MHRQTPSIIRLAVQFSERWSAVNFLVPMGTERLTEIDFHSVTIRAMWQKDNAMLLISHNLNNSKNSPEQMNSAFLFCV